LKLFDEILEKFPSIRPVLLLLKFILRQRGYNETYTGGLGSYLLLNMIYAFVQYLINRGQERNIHNLGQFFLGFLRFFGVEFNYKELGISINNGGYFFNKRQKNFYSNDGLAFENYQDEELDIGKGAYQFVKIRQLFKELLQIIYKVNNSSESYLVNIINITSDMMRRCS
jgi:non-canonical poly(A) RNA polymerase PAPD5/7